MKFRQLESSFKKACFLDVLVSKPGNVSLSSPGHGMTAKQFIESSKAVGPFLFDKKKSLGKKIEESVNASFKTSECNTNLGIILLCAPLIQAFQNLGNIDYHYHKEKNDIFCILKNEIRTVIKNTTIEDTKYFFRGIKKANPGGLGSVEVGDVKFNPKINLYDSMYISKDRDLISKQYSNFFSDIFEHVSEQFLEFEELKTSRKFSEYQKKLNLNNFVLKIFFRWLISFPDTHISRKYGEETAKNIQNEALMLLFGNHDIETFTKEKKTKIPLPPEKILLNWDFSLKSRKINPGTSADLTVCSLFLFFVFFPELKYIK